jgi:5-formyltetrahydrofolate cyclo-ligase
MTGRPVREDEAAQEEQLRRKVKAELRTRMRGVRRALPLEARAARSERIWQRVLAREEWARAQTVMLFLSMRTEVDTLAAAEAAWSAGKRVCAPRVTEQGLAVHEWVRGVAPIETGSLRVPEPPEDAPMVDPREVDLVIVPALALDDRGARIGYGAGYYDHLLPRLERAARVAIAFDFQLIAEVPETPGDERVHVVITDERAIDVAR